MKFESRNVKHKLIEDEEQQMLIETTILLQQTL